MRDLFEAIAEYMSAEGADARREHAKKVRIEFDLVQDRMQEMQSRIEALEQFERAYKEWSDKTEWVQQTAKPQELGKHRADVLRERIEALEKDAKMLDWMQENYLCADFRYGEPATEVIVIEMPKRSRFCGNLRVDIDTAMQSEKGDV